MLPSTKIAASTDSTPKPTNLLHLVKIMPNYRKMTDISLVTDKINTIRHIEKNDI